MAIKYFPNRSQIASKHAIERNRDYPKKMLHAGGDITSSGLDKTFSPENSDWIVYSVGFIFSDSSNKDYQYSIQNGRKVVEKYNDFLWIQTTNSLWQKITLDSGFYTGTELAAHLKTKLDANEEFSDLGITFTVTYNNVSGLYTITPSSTEIRYIQEYQGFKKSDQNSIAGHLFGLNSNTAFANSVSSDSSVPGLDNALEIINQTGSSATSHYNDDIKHLSIDQAVKITTGTSSLDATVTIQYSQT